MSSANRSAREQAIYDSLVYPGGSVLRNKLGITNQTALDEAEADAVALAEPTRPRFKKFSLLEMRSVHKHLLADLNGRVTRLFLKDLAAQAGHQLSIKRLEAQKGAWYEAMREGFASGDTEKLRQEILNALDVSEKTASGAVLDPPARHQI